MGGHHYAAARRHQALTWPAGENDGSVALLKGRNGRFKLGSTVINLFCTVQSGLLEQLESLSVKKLASRWQYLPKPLLRQMLNQPRFLLKRSKQNTTPAHWLTIKKTV